MQLRMILSWKNSFALISLVESKILTMARQHFASRSGRLAIAASCRYERLEVLRFLLIVAAAII